MALVLGTGAAQADTVLRAILLNSEEPGSIVPTTSTGGFRPVSFGTATFVLNAAETAMTMIAEVHNIDFTGTQTADNFDNLTVAHIHGSGLEPPPATRPVVWGFIGTPFNDTTPTDTVVTPFVTGVGGTVTSKWDLPEGQNTTLDAQIQNILNARTYLNFHTVQFSGGEVRGTLLVIPEPTALLLVALAGTPLLLRRRQRNAA
jgi:hypothetical protein